MASMCLVVVCSSVMIYSIFDVAGVSCSLVSCHLRLLGGWRRRRFIVVLDGYAYTASSALVHSVGKGFLFVGVVIRLCASLRALRVGGRVLCSCLRAGEAGACEVVL